MAFTQWQRRDIDAGNLGAMYTKERGVEQDFVRAHMSFDLAAAESTGNCRESATENRDRIAAKMTAEQIGTAQEMAQRCQELSLRSATETPCTPIGEERRHADHQ